MPINKSIYDEMSSEIIENPIFRTNYRDLLKIQKMGVEHSSTLVYAQIENLLKCAGILCFSKEEKNKKIANKIVTILVENYSHEYNELSRICQYILINTGQLPVVKKNVVIDKEIDYFSIYQESEFPYNPIVYRDIVVKQLSNRVPLQKEKSNEYFTDFQSNVFSDLSQGKSMSISAPTSAGKSFLLIAYLAKKYRETDRLNVVYIVPTRALIAQVQKDVISELKKYDIPEIFISSAPKKYDKDQLFLKKFFIFTQERFHNLLFDSDFVETLDILIIDEAQKVSDFSRGILLEEVIEEAIKRNPLLQKIFLSPFVSNPEKFAQIFNLEGLKAEKTNLSPVCQNVIKINVDIDKFEMYLSNSEFAEEFLIKTDLVSKNDLDALHGVTNWPLIWAAKNFSDSNSIIYCNSASTCVKNAQSLCRLLPDISDNPNITEAIKFLIDNVHRDYYLIECLSKGVGYHHGKMPPQIRLIVENLFKNKDISFLFCTSTLLEGVNLPAKNIFIHKPEQGKKPNKKINYMEKGSFWNLAGRAGRLLKDYYGNIYCINVKEWKGYQPDPHDFENEIESGLEKAVINKNEEIMKGLKQMYRKMKINDLQVEQALTKFLIQSMKTGETSFVENLLKRNPQCNEDLLTQIEKEVMEMSKKIEIPAKIIQKNSSINPLIQQKLFDVLKTERIPLPTYPFSPYFSSRLKQIFQYIDIFFREFNLNNQTYTFTAPIAEQWIRGKKVSELIQYKMNNPKYNAIPKNKEFVNKQIEELFDVLDKQIRFDYQKYLKCYIDILSHYYEISGFEDPQFCEELPLFIEFGSYNRNAITLQSIGLSRFSALSITELLNRDFLNEMDCKIWLRENLPTLQRKLSPVLFNEVKLII